MSISVWMCDGADTHGWKACPHAVSDRRTIGLTEILDPNVEAFQGMGKVLFLLRQELSLNPVCDSEGVPHMLPDGCRFVVHRERGVTSLGGTIRELRPGGFVDLAVTPQDGDAYTSILSSPSTDLDELLAGSPEWTDERMQEQLALLRAA